MEWIFWYYSVWHNPKNVFYCAHMLWTIPCWTREHKDLPLPLVGQFEAETFKFMKHQMGISVSLMFNMINAVSTQLTHCILRSLSDCVTYFPHTNPLCVPQPRETCNKVATGLKACKTTIRAICLYSAWL